MQVTLTIPDFAPMTLNSDIRELQETIKQDAALMLYKQGKLSFEQACSFADLDAYAFMRACARNGIAVIRYNQEELENELALLRDI